jgi:hypothetical protein
VAAGVAPAGVEAVAQEVAEAAEAPAVVVAAAVA